MGMLEVPATAPDVVGLPEYRPSDFCWEIDGWDIRVAIMETRFQQPEWRYTILMTPEALIDLCQRLIGAAIEAQRVLQSMRPEQGH